MKLDEQYTPQELAKMVDDLRAEVAEKDRRLETCMTKHRDLIVREQWRNNDMLQLRLDKAEQERDELRAWARSLRPRELKDRREGE